MQPAEHHHHTARATDTWPFQRRTPEQAATDALRNTIHSSARTTSRIIEALAVQATILAEHTELEREARHMNNAARTLIAYATDITALLEREDA